MKKLVTVLLALSLVLCAAAALAEVELTDMLGRTVTLQAPASRVVSLTASNVELQYALGAGDRLVGRGAYCSYPAEVFEVPVVQSGNETNVEEILALEPDVVIMDIMAQTEEQIKALTDAGVAVVVTRENGMDGIYEAAALVGRVLGCEAEAETLVQQMKQGFEDAAAMMNGSTDMTVYLEVSGPEWGDPWIAGSGTMMDELITMLGLKNAFADVEGWGTVSVEQIIERDPQLMILTDGWTAPDAVYARDGWGDIAFVTNGFVFKPTEDIQIPGPRLVDVAFELAGFLNGLTTAETPAA